MSRPLRIFLCCQQSNKRHAVPAYGFWVEYFRHGLSEAEHDWVEAPECDWAEGLLPLDAAARAAWQDRTWSNALVYLRREHARKPVDFFLSYLYPQQVLPAAFAEIRALGIPTVNFFCDNVREFRQVPVEFHAFDLNWVPEYKAGPLYQQAGLSWINAPMPCWVPSDQRISVEKENLPVTFIGTRDEQRAALMTEVLQRGLQLELRGLGWIPTTHPEPAFPPQKVSLRERTVRQIRFARQHGWAALSRKILPQPPVSSFDFTPYTRPAPSGEAYWQMLRECSVCLGINRYPSLRFPFAHPDSYSRLRDIEAPMAGACYLTEWTEGLEQLYDLSREIETYRTGEELVEKARALTADTPRRRKMRTAGQKRALDNHSISRSIERIATRLGVLQ